MEQECEADVAHRNILHSSLFTSCIDTNVLPDDKTIEEDFWKTKADVQLMVTGAYRQMVNAAVVERALVWGETRSDEVLVNTTPTGTIPTALQEVEAADIQPSNTFTDWAAFYSVINYCNIVLEKAGQVMEIDPSYTREDYLTDRSQVLSLRALCYFYLVRAYRDVPFTTEAFINSSQQLEIPQSAPLTVINQCIADVREALQTPIISDPTAFGDWRSVGYFTEDGINALLADLYLWRGSLTHSNADYDSCAICCQRVIESKQQYYPKNVIENPDGSDYALLNGDVAFSEIFVRGNSQEAVLELQLDGDNNSNSSVCSYYYLYNRSAAHGYLFATSIFASIANEQVYRNSNDYRYWQNTYDVGSTILTNYDVRKMSTESAASVNPQSSPTAFKRSDELRPYGTFAQNWIVYRLSDILLMKAEALVAKAAGDDDPLLQEAFTLVAEVNTRSLAVKSEALKFVNYASVQGMETLVLEERQRELCFEGKRWWDLMRLNYRHITPADPAKTLAELGDEGITFANNYEQMLTLATRKYDDGAGIVARMRTEPSLYWPVNQSEMKVNTRLRQNPAYATSDLYQKNY